MLWGENGREAGKSGIWRIWGGCSGKALKTRTKAEVGFRACEEGGFQFYFCSGTLRTTWLQGYRLFGFFWLGRTLAGQASKIQSDSQNAPRDTPAVDFAHP